MVSCFGFVGRERRSIELVVAARENGRMVHRPMQDMKHDDTFGFDAVGIGDVDRDGTVDLLVTSAWSAVKGYHSGRVFVISSGVKRGRRT